MIKMLKCSSPQLMASGGDAGGERLLLLQGVGHRDFDDASVSIWITQIGLGCSPTFFFFLFFFLSFLEGRSQWLEADLEDWKVSVIRVHDVKSPNNQ